MTVCPTCGHVVVLPSAITVTINRAGVYGVTVVCTTCKCEYTQTVRITRHSPLTIEQLKQVMNQPR